jgi:hypothetical protein
MASTMSRHFKLIAVSHGDGRKILPFDFSHGYVRVWCSGPAQNNLANRLLSRLVYRTVDEIDRCPR